MKSKVSGFIPFRFVNPATCLWTLSDVTWLHFQNAFGWPCVEEGGRRDQLQVYFEMWGKCQANKYCVGLNFFNPRTVKCKDIVVRENFHENRYKIYMAELTAAEISSESKINFWYLFLLVNLHRWIQYGIKFTSLIWKELRNDSFMMWK